MIGNQFSINWINRRKLIKSTMKIIKYNIELRNNSISGSINFSLISILILMITLQPGWSQSSGISWDEALNQEESWYASKEAQRIADNVLLYQNNNGGWLKNIDMTIELSPTDIKTLKREKSQKSGTTIDNGATHTQLKYLAKVYDGTEKQEYKDSFLKGIDFLIEAQYESGGWPQFYPLKKGYYEHITFNDDAMMGVMNLLSDIANQKEPYQFVDKARCERSKIAIDKGLEVLLKTQVEVDGHLTVWGAQHDKDDLKPAKARAYELASLSGKESVMIVEYLMELDQPTEDVKNAVRSAVKWFEENKILDIEVVWEKDPSIPGGENRLVKEKPGAGPLWARFYQIGTNKPIFVGRDGLLKKTHNEIEYERRINYSYLGNYAEDLLNNKYPVWEKKHK